LPLTSLLCAPLLHTLLLSLYCPVLHRDLHSFPTRRSSDLPSPTPVVLCDSLFLMAASNLSASVIIPVLYNSVTSSFITPFLSFADRKSTRLNSSHVSISYAVFCLKKKTLIKSNFIYYNVYL